MEVVVRGAGPALVLLHGWAMHGGVFDALARRLEAQFTLHLVDLPGHGLSRDSAVPLALDAVADALVARLPPAPWCGWSLGGLVALHAAQRHPAQVRGLGMLYATPCFVRRADWPEGMDPAVFARFTDDLATDPRVAVDRFLQLEALGSDHAREELRALRAIVYAHGEPVPARLADGLRLLEDCDGRAALPSLPMPTLWLSGRRDRIVSPEAMRRAAAACGGRYVQVHGGSHAPFLTHADEVAPAVQQLAADAAWAAA